jgi:diguanylate cyclase (GGDEF)-like protein
MKLRNKAIIYFISFIILWIIVITNILLPYVQNKFETFEEIQRERTIIRVESAISDFILKNEAIILDWTKWDEAYRFVESPNDKFISENITMDVFIDHGIDYIVLYDSEGRVVLASGYDFSFGEEKEVPDEIIQLLPRHKNETGIMLIGDQILIFSHYQVSNSDSSKVSNGSFSFVFEVKREDIKLLGGVMQEDIILADTMLDGKIMGITKEILFKEHEDIVVFKVPYANIDACMTIELRLHHEVAALIKEFRTESLTVVFISFFILSGIIFIGLHYAVLRIEKLNCDVIRIRENNDLGVRIDIGGKDELGMLRDNINDMLEHIDSMHNQLTDYATLDTLTGILNRRSGFEILEMKMYEAKKRKAPLSICYIDINDLKYVNDTYGHNAGDVYLQEICKNIENGIRIGDIFCRLGGDEFLVIFPQCNENGAQKTIDRIKTQIDNENGTNNYDYSMSISSGVVEYDFESDLIHYVELADTKMYEDKQRFKSK